MTQTSPREGDASCPLRADSRLSPPTPPLAATHASELTDWRPLVERFQCPSVWRGTWQLATTLGAYIGTWVLMYFALAVSWWLVLPLIALSAGLLVRVFIIFHDATHGSFFPSRAANDMVGRITGVLTFTPYWHWRAEHAIHHGATGDLDRRGTGDVWTMTVREYLEASRWRKLSYRIARNPFVLFVVAPFVLFVGIHRFARKGASVREQRSVLMTNVSLFALFCVLASVFGFVPFLIIQLSVMAMAGAMGIWLFYLQHQYEDAYWERHADWDYVAAALRGSSFLRLPKVLQWFSGNIGFHHIHHLSPRIPNYHLERCHRSSPVFESVTPMTFWSSFRSLRLRLWDEASRKLVGWRHLRTLRNETSAAIASPGSGG